MRTVLLAWLAAAVLRRMFVVVTVRGDSMRPTYADGDVLLAVRLPVLRRGRAIVFVPPTEVPGTPRYRVKRLAALQGDPTPAWVRHARADAPVPPGRVVVRGDNVGSEDSSTYGYVDRASVHAVVVRRLTRTPVLRRPPAGQVSGAPSSRPIAKVASVSRRA